MELLRMSAQERNRLVVLHEVQLGKLKLVKAAEVMGVSYRQAKRLWRRYRQEGDSGLVHRSRGRPSGRSKGAKLKARVLARYQERYPDFGPTLAAEKLEEEGLRVDHETLRRWLLSAGIWQLRRRRQQHRQWRERKACYGQMVQLDGSHHDWFEGRREPCVLMVMVDDATSRTQARFFEQETTHASYDVLEVWGRQAGLPQSLYVDRDSIYRCEGLPTVAEQLAGQEPQTQFGRAMKQLGIELILAHSPQAKGRVERRNGLLQDRLVKELRLRGIADLDQANAFLKQEFLPQLNRRFVVEPASAADVHQPLPRNLDEILSWEYPRVVQKDWTVAWDRRHYQITARERGRNLVGRTITVRRLRDGRELLVHQGQCLRSKLLPARPQRPPPAPRPAGRTRLLKPAAEHPWRHYAWAAQRKRSRPKTRWGGGAPNGAPGATPRTATEGSAALRSAAALPPLKTAPAQRSAPGTRGHFLAS
jgi:transposase